MDRTTKKIDFSEKYETESLKGKSALVTGGATGIGQGSAVGLAEAGAYVTIADINEKDAEETVKELTSKGLHAQFIKTDVSSWESLVAAFKATIAFSPNETVDIFIPAAGISNGGIRNWLDTLPVDDNGDPTKLPYKVMDINLEAVFNSTHLALYYFKKNPGPDISVPKQIIFVASMGGYSSMTGVLDYCTSKWGVRGMFRSLRGAYEILGKDKPKIRVNLIAPTYVKTNMTKNYWDYMEKMGVHLAEVSDCTDVVLRMAADETVIGRSACIAKNRGSFDLCDDAEGLDGGREVRDSAKKLYSAPRNVDEVPKQGVPADVIQGKEATAAVAAEVPEGIEETGIGRKQSNGVSGA